MGCIPGFGEHNSGWHPIDITRVGYVTGHFEEKAHVSVKCLLQAIFFFHLEVSRGGRCKKQ